MVRKILLASIMVVSVLIIVVALQRLNEKEQSRKPRKPEAEPLAKIGGAVELYKYDKNNNLVAVIRGIQATQLQENGPVDILQPVITLLKDKNNYTVIKADTGQVAGRDQAHMQEGWLKGNVTVVVTNRTQDDNTLVTCDELKFFGEQGQVSIPGKLTIHNRTLDLTGVGLTADRNMDGARVERDIQLTMANVAGGSMDKLTGDEKPAVDAAPKPAQPIVILADGPMVFEPNASRATFEKSVRASQGDNRVRADRMVVDFDKGSPEPAEPGKPAAGGLNIRKVVMTSEKKDGVEVEGPSRQGRGDRFDYDTRDGYLVFSGSPCRMSQKSAGQTYQLEGDDVRFGRKRLLSQAKTLPSGMSESSSKVLITGKPARVVGVPDKAGDSSVLVADLILFDQDSHVAWLEGTPAQHALASQGKSRVEGVEVLFAQKTETRGEKISAKGPGRLEVAGRAKDGSDTPAAPSTVDFGTSMDYQPDRQQAEFTGGVHLVDGATNLKSRTLAVEFAEGATPGSREIRKMTAVGDVVVTGDKLGAVAETLVYGYPSADSKNYVAHFTPKPGESCEVRSGDLLCRSEKIDMTQTSAPDGRTAMHAKGWGKGYILYRPAPKADNTTQAQPFEVHYEKSGTYDDAALEAVFDGNVRVKRTTMDLTGQHVVMHFTKRPTTATPATTAPGKTGSNLDVAGLTAEDNVTLISGTEADPMTATGNTLAWDRVKGIADLRGDARAPAHVVRDKTDITAPVILGTLKNERLDRVVTKGGGHMIGYTHPLQQAAKPGETVAAAPAPLQKLDVTWTGEGFYETLEAKDTAKEPTAVMRVKQNVHAVSQDSDVTSDTLVVYMGPQAKPSTSATTGGLKLEMRNLFAIGNARAKTFMPDGNYYRYARGDTLEWDRLTNRMLVSADTGDAVVWDNSNEWIGKQLVVNRSEGGKMEVDSTSGRKIIFYEEGTPKTPSTDDGRDWKPVY